MNFKLIVFLFFAGFPLLMNSAIAQVPPPPTILDIGPGGCVPTEEICGDGIDQNCDGVDSLCPGGDVDEDGFPTGQDCDNNSRYVYPGISVACSAGCGQGTMTCQSNGTYSACSCTPLCEATAGGSCYYVSSESGSDSNPGTFAAPWKSYLNIVSSDGSNPNAANPRTLHAGDVVYFMSGIYRDTYNYYNQKEAFFLRGLNGTANAKITIKAYPGAHPVLWPVDRANALHILQCSYLLIEGFEIMGAYGAGLHVAAANNIDARSMWIHDTDGIDNDNVAGLYLTGAENTIVHHSLIHDNYDRTNDDTGGQKTENSRNVVLFGGGNIRLHHNVIFQTPPTTSPKTGGCITYKHSASVAGSIFEVDHNILKNCYQPSIGSGSFGTRIHHNLIVDSHPIELRDFGGPTHNRDVIIEYNTIVRQIGLLYNPSTDYGPVGSVIFRKNIIWDNSTSYNYEHGMATIGTYQSDALYNAVVSAGTLSFSQNCYYSTGGGALKWDLYGRNGGGYGTLGGLYGVSEWQGLGFDTNSVFSNPQMDANFIPQAAACQNYGRFGQ